MPCILFKIRLRVENHDRCPKTEIQIVPIPTPFAGDIEVSDITLAHKVVLGSLGAWLGSPKDKIYSP